MTNSFLRNLILSFSFLILGIKANAQFSKTHYIPPISAFNHDNSEPQDQYLYISTPSIDPVNIKITPIGGTIINATASKTSPYKYLIGTGYDTQLFVDDNLTNRVYSNKGYVVEAEDLIYVTLKLNGSTTNAQAGALVSKGIAGLGKEFRSGSFYNPNITEASMNFISVMATENNTVVTISNLPTGISYINNSGQGNNDIQIRLNNGESYLVAAKNSATPTTQANSDAFVGALITSDKLIAVNCGSLNGTNSISSGARDYGFDQIVPIERIGNEYIFTRAFGNDEMENPIIVAHEDNTDIYINGDNSTGTFVMTINAGEYHAIQGDEYSSGSAGGNLYVWASKNVFAYQGVGGTTNAANQGLFFVPPLNCETPIVVDNIPLIDEIGDRVFEGGLSVLTKLNADLKINNIDVGSLGVGITVTGPTTVAGKTDYVTYLIEGLSGNVSIESTKEVYVAAFGYNGSASFGGYYSGFSIKPEVFFDSALSSDGCLPGVKLGLNSLTSFDEFQWYKDGVKIDGETNISYEPTVPGYYQVEGKILCSNTSLFSDNIPVSNCTERDIYDIPRNIDLDYDNDGILNCTESLGEFPFDLNNTSGGNFINGTYTYDYNVDPINTAASTPFSGNNDGVFSMEVPAGVTNAVVYESNFNSPLNIKIKYPETSISSNSEFTSEEHFIINVPKDQTITIYNPDDQLLIDTNYDGIYESGITEFSAFEVRIKSNATSIGFGTGTFSISAYQVESIKVTLINDSDFETNKASLQILTSCIPLDSDNDSIPDYLDLDSDNDGIPDITEAQAVIATNTPSTTDTNKDGLFDIFETSSQNIIDSDLDTVLDYLDLDSDNDGIYDLFEADHSALDINLDGIIDGNNMFFGTNGLSNSLETSADNGIINYSINDSNSNTFPNSVELDSDSDGCNDVIEAGFSDLNGNGLLGNGTPTTNLKGIVTSRTDGYSFPNSDYTLSAPLEITKQPIDEIICEFETATFSITSNSTDIQWQFSTDGIVWTDVIDNSIYSGATTGTLVIKDTPTSINDYLFRASVSKTGNGCGLNSDSVKLTVDKNSTIISFNSVGPFCTNDADVNLVVTPTGGEFSGNGVTKEGLFSPNTTLEGDHKITYTLTNVNGCTNSSEITIKVNTIPNPAIVESIQTFCTTDGTSITVADLTVTNPGTNNINWYSSLTGGTKLSPSDALVHNKIYFAELENANACTSEIRTETTVFLSSPKISASDEEICFGEKTILTVNGIPETPQDFRNSHPELSYVTNYNDSHYFIKKESISWEAANIIGTNLPGASMYIINDTAEETAVYNALQSQGLTGDDGISYWFGLKQINTASDFSEPSGGWYWTDGTPLTYNNWEASEPNDWPSNTVDNEENYAQFEFSNNGIKWNDAINNSIDRNSYPLFEFTGTTDVQWGYYNSSGIETPLPDSTSTLEIAPTETTTYFIKVTTNGVECKDEFTVTVNPLPTFTVTNPGAMCNNADPTLLTILPKGGTFTGPGVSSTGLFTPENANVGTNTISYEFTDDKGCTNSTILDILIYEVPEIVFTPQGEICENGNSIPLNATPIGGAFSGTGVSAAGLFDPTIALQGTHKITYTIITLNGCISQNTIDIKVNPEPNIIFSPVPEICINATPIQLNATPTGGIYSGSGVSTSGVFDPLTAGEGSHPITYTFNDTNNCTSEKTATILVNQLGIVTITPVDPLCIDAPIKKLTATPIGGEFSGNGTNINGDFDPKLAGVGAHTVTYTYLDTNNCSASNTLEIIVNDLPSIVFLEINELCIDANEVLLNATPEGGTYSSTSGSITSNGLFSPSISGTGTHRVIYEYEDPITLCSDSRFIDIIVNPLPIVKLELQSPLCLEAAEVPLSASPVGGTFTGVGVTSTGMFNPTNATAGSHVITYLFSDTNGCEKTDSITIIVHPLPELTFKQPSPMCLDAENTQFVVTPLGGVFEGKGIDSTTGIFSPLTAGIGTHTVKYTYTDGNTCVNSISRNIVVNPIPSLTVFDDNLCIGSFKNLNLLASSDAGMSITFFETEVNAETNNNTLLSNEVNPIVSQSYFAKATNPTTGCFDIKEIIITVVPLPTLSPVTIIQCDDETSDGFTFFNLRIKEEEISTNYTTETFTYYITKEGAENKDETQKISDPIAYKNQTINTDTVWVHVENENGCEQVTQIDLAVSTTDIPNDFEITYDTCDDFLDIDGNDSVNNDDTDGITLFDFNDATEQIRALFPVGQTPRITYFRNEADGLAERNPIVPNTYRNIGYENLQYIYVRVDSDINNDCLGFGPHIKLTVNPIPNFNPVENIQLCDDNTDGYVADFDLESKTTEILGSQSNIDFNVTYHKTIDDANTGNNSISSPYTNETRDRQTIYIRVLNNKTDCINPHGVFDIIVNPLPIFTNIPTYEVCDDETVDGLVSAFDLNSKIPDILGTSQKEEDYIVTFHETQAQAESNSDVIPDVIFTNTTAWNQTIFIRIENKATECVNDQGTIELKVNQKPEFTVEENQIVCIDNPDGLDLTISDPLATYQYEWFDSKGISLGFGETNTVYQGDTYTVKATILASPECPVSKDILVKESSAPTIVNFKVTDGFNLGTILVLVDGIGEFEYQINDGSFQAEPLFENLLTGTHSITVNDKNGCGSDTRLDITVLIFDKYFTPNNDGHGKNEWGIDIDPTKYKTGAIKIFDRSGRLLKNMNPLSTNSNENSWDGTFNGKIMPATDYWFSLELTDNKGETIVKTGNFSLVL